MAQQFQIRQKLGDSLFGKVFLCDYISSLGSSSPEDITSPTSAPPTNPVAVKCISMQKVRQLKRTCFPRSIDNPIQEQKVTELLSSHGGHCNLLQTYAHFVDGDLYEFTQSRPDSLLSEHGTLRLMRQIVSGVSFLHQHGVAHRDLSLENVLLANKTCKIADFGLSTDAFRTYSGFVGKDYYIAPEIVARQRYDPVAADV